MSLSCNRGSNTYTLTPALLAHGLTAISALRMVMTVTLGTLEMQHAQAACEKCFIHNPSQVSLSSFNFTRISHK